MWNKTSKIIVAFAALSLIIPAVSRGAVMEYTVTMNNGGDNYTAGNNGNFLLPQFNPTYGTLQSVLITITANTLGGYYRIDNEGAGSGVATISYGASLTVVGPDDIMLFALPSVSSNKFVLPDNDGAPDYVGTDAFSLTAPTATDTQTANPPATLNPYLGSGNVSFSFYSSVYQGILTGGSLNQGSLSIDSIPPSFNFIGKATYTYEPAPTPPGGNVPEPGTLSMALVLAGMALTLWIRQQHHDRRRDTPPASGR